MKYKQLFWYFSALQAEEAFHCLASNTKYIMVPNSTVAKVSLVSPCYPEDYYTRSNCEFREACFIAMDKIPNNRWVGVFVTKSNPFSVQNTDTVTAKLNDERIPMNVSISGLQLNYVSTQYKRLSILHHRTNSPALQLNQLIQNFKLDVKGMCNKLK